MFPLEIGLKLLVGGLDIEPLFQIPKKRGHNRRQILRPRGNCERGCGQQHKQRGAEGGFHGQFSFAGVVSIKFHRPGQGKR